MMGDSQALTLGQGLSVYAQHWNVQFDNQGEVGCAFDAGKLELEDDGLIGIDTRNCVNGPKPGLK